MHKFLAKRTQDAKDLPLPARMSKMAAGMDLYANVKESVTIKRGERMRIPTGICIALPYGYEAQMRPRSGLALKHGITMLNSPGTIDADYRGELTALLINLGEADYVVRRGDRVAQLVLAKVEMGVFEEADELPESDRGTSGFGSSGK